MIKDQIIGEVPIDVSDEEMNNKINEMIVQDKKSEDKINAFFKESNNKKNLYNEILNNKLFEFLSNYVKVKVIEKSTNELRKKQVA